LPGNKYGSRWTEDETILAFYYYCQIPFGKINKDNPEIKRIADILGRTPSSISFKMGNLAHFDPEMKKRSISGLKNASKMDEDVVSRFFENWEELTLLAISIERRLSEQKTEEFPEGKARNSRVDVRVNQDFFRTAVLSSYHQKCCITGIDIPDLLIASHIKPWKDSNPKTERTNPCNGLCLNALHDKAFDKGLITVLPDYTVRVSSKLKANNEGLGWLLQCNNSKILLPRKFVPSRVFLEYHNDVVFIP